MVQDIWRAPGTIMSVNQTDICLILKVEHPQMEGAGICFIIKVDLLKAYDKISRDFIWRVLVEIKIPNNLRNLIMHAMTSMETNVKWNGLRSQYLDRNEASGKGILFHHICLSFAWRNYLI